MAKKIDWTKPLVHVGNLKASYMGKTTDARYPHVVAIEWTASDVVVDTFDEYGRTSDDSVVVLSNAPEPNELQNGLWANINRDSGGNLYLDLSVYRTRADAKRAAGPSHFKSIRLSTVPFIGSGPSEDDGLDQ